MRINHHTRSAHEILTSAQVPYKSDTNVVAPPPETEDSFYPGTVHSGGVTSLLAPRTAKQQFEFETRLEALSKGWPQQRHLEIERKQRISIVGGYIARQLHTRMIKGLRE